MAKVSFFAFRYLMLLSPTSFGTFGSCLLIYVINFWTREYHEKNQYNRNNVLKGELQINVLSIIFYKRANLLITQLEYVSQFLCLFSIFHYVSLAVYFIQNSYHRSFAHKVLARKSSNIGMALTFMNVLC